MLRSRRLLARLARVLASVLGLLAVGAGSFFLTNLYLGQQDSRRGGVARPKVTPNVLDENNLMPRSDDPAQWPPSMQEGARLGGAVADPFDGRRARAITFDEASFFFGATRAGPPAGKSFSASIYLRAPSGKAEIAVMLVGSQGGFIAERCRLGPAWTRCEVKGTIPSFPDSPQLLFGLDNRATVLPGMDAAPGVVEACCAHVVATPAGGEAK